jgi:hypothetical protein
LKTVSSVQGCVDELEAELLNATELQEKRPEEEGSDDGTWQLFALFIF